ncbi:hypothetical protein GGS20DRAFT_477443 [Poronia punctata]|nr:hypothetical protein GGS20DRAFT_477443 [Poronia punctata]
MQVFNVCEVFKAFEFDQKGEVVEQRRVEISRFNRAETKCCQAGTLFKIGSSSSSIDRKGKQSVVEPGRCLKSVRVRVRVRVQSIDRKGKSVVKPERRSSRVEFEFEFDREGGKSVVEPERRSSRFEFKFEFDREGKVSSSRNVVQVGSSLSSSSIKKGRKSIVEPERLLSRFEFDRKGRKSIVEPERRSSRFEFDRLEGKEKCRRAGTLFKSVRVRSGGREKCC